MDMLSGWRQVALDNFFRALWSSMDFWADFVIGVKKFKDSNKWT